MERILIDRDDFNSVPYSSEMQILNVIAISRSCLCGIILVMMKDLNKESSLGVSVDDDLKE